MVSIVLSIPDCIFARVVGDIVDIKFAAVCSAGTDTIVAPVLTAVNVVDGWVTFAVCTDDVLVKLDGVDALSVDALVVAVLTAEPVFAVVAAIVVDAELVTVVTAFKVELLVEVIFLAAEDDTAFALADAADATAELDAFMLVVLIEDEAELDDDFELDDEDEEDFELDDELDFPVENELAGFDPTEKELVAVPTVTGIL